MKEHTVRGNDFVIDGKPVQLISGAIHYFRIHPDLWEDRLKKMKACGLNAIETYVPWNMHEPQPGKFNFDGFYDIEKFIEIAGNMGLYVLVRPGPFICAEFEGGGLPWWLNNIPGMAIRCANKEYLKRCEIFYKELIPRIIPTLCTNGGPVIAVQIENEYGSYGNDKTYLKYLKDLFIELGIDVLFFTSDGPEASLLSSGTLPEVLKTANFGSRPEENFEELKKAQPTGPMMCMEYWNGWFDHWGGKHLEQKRPIEDHAGDLDRMLAAGHSINFYMFHGGTNFGFTSGANFNKTIVPTITSYDYGAPLSESGDMTEKYYAYKDVISKHVKIDDSIEVENSAKFAFSEVELNQCTSLFDTLDELKWVENANPLSMESMEQGYGFILYRTTLVSTDWQEAPEFLIKDLHDRAYIFLDGEFKGIIEREDAKKPFGVGMVETDMQLDILVENFGRINFGLNALDRKGITDCVHFSGRQHYGWKMMSIPLEDISKINFAQNKIKSGDPVFYKGNFNVEKPADTFISMDGWKKGVVFVNGFNLGRYWEIGPQKTLYLPAPLLKQGENEIVVFELQGNQNNIISFKTEPDLG